LALGAVANLARPLGAITVTARVSPVRPRRVRRGRLLRGRILFVRGGGVSRTLRVGAVTTARRGAVDPLPQERAILDPGSVDLLESLFGAAGELGVSQSVGVQPLRERAIRPLDLGRRRVLRHAERLIVAFPWPHSAFAEVVYRDLALVAARRLYLASTGQF